MSVRHVYARQGEHIKVHRRQGKRKARKRGTSDFYAYLFIGGIALVAIILFWKILLTLLLAAGTIALIYFCRKPIFLIAKNIWRECKKISQSKNS